MSPKKETPEIVVEIAGSDNEDDAAAFVRRTMLQESRPKVNATPSDKTTPQNLQQIAAAKITPSVPVNVARESRSFWRAGDFAPDRTIKAVPVQDTLEHARVHPKFLHSNATSHKWAFGAIAELLDNAVDEVQNGATFVKVDKVDVMKDNSPALLFKDDGSGMDPESLRKCMSLGYSTKKSNKTIGQYGNGFKTSTMRLGADVIVFSRANHARKATQSVGLLSYTFLRKTGQDDVIVPMIDFDISGHWAEPIIYSSQDDWSFNLKTILEWSPFESKSELLQQFEDIGPHGTKVIIYNLWMNDEGIYELSFDDDDEDICLRDEASNGSLKKLNKKALELQSHISYRIRYSLRAYASMLYLRKFNSFRIVLRGKPVEQFNIANELRHPKVISYKPNVSTEFKDVVVETTVGFLKETPALSVSGFNVYHKNRLIRPFWKVTADGSSKGNGVVGVLEANFIEPTHSKQDFERSTLFVRLQSRLKQMIVAYWKENYHLIRRELPGSGAYSMQNGDSVQPPVGHAANMQKKPADQHKYPVLDIQEEEYNNEVTPEDHLVSVSELSVDQLCEENIRLFMKCEEHLLKEHELKQLIEKLEEEVEQAKLKCAQLSSEVEARKKQKTSEQEREEVP